MSDKTGRYKNESEDELHVTVRAKTITGIRYKVYIFFIGLFIFIFWPNFITAIEDVRGTGAFSFSLTDPINSTLYARGQGGMLNQLDDQEKKIQELEKEKVKIGLEKQVVEQLTNEGKVNTLVNCINVNECDEVPPELLPSMSLLRVFLIINTLDAIKMDFDQKMLLRNINEFLLRTPGGVLNGLLQSINFGGIQEVNKELGLMQLSVTLKIEFAHKKMLTSFLDNLENKVHLELPVMYMINSVNYDIVNYQESQTIDVNLIVYFYKSDRKDTGLPTQNEGKSGPISDKSILEDLQSIGQDETGTGGVQDEVDEENTNTNDSGNEATGTGSTGSGVVAPAVEIKQNADG